jgi:hypothetical protein
MGNKKPRATGGASNKLAFCTRAYAAPPMELRRRAMVATNIMARTIRKETAGASFF